MLGMRFFALRDVPYLTSSWKDRLLTLELLQRRIWATICSSITSVTLTALFIVSSNQLASAQTVSYKRQIAPIFATSCNACHSGPSPQSALNISTYSALSKGGRRGKAIIPGDPSKSLLVQFIDGTKQPRMPIGGTLKAAEIALIVKWVREGAKVDGDANATTT